MNHKLAGAEIFKAGTWNDRTFTEQDLDNMVAAFNATGKAGRVPLKFGHSDDESGQPFREGLPALGWVSKVWRQGKTLFADFIDIPNAVFQAIQKGLYKFVSIEILKNAEYDGKSYPWLLDAVALLGAEPPAVDGLGDLQRLALSRASFKYAEVCVHSRQTHMVTPHQEIEMDPKEIAKAIADGIREQIAPLQSKIDEQGKELSKFSKENDTLKAQLVDKDKAIADQAKAAEAEKVKHARDTVKNVLEAGVRAKKILPAERERFERLLKVDDDKAVVSIDLKEVEALAKVNQEEATRILAAGKSAFSRADGKSGEGASAVGDTEDHAVVDDLFKLCSERARKENRSVFSVLPEVVREDAKLGRRFHAYVIDAGKAA